MLVFDTPGFRTRVLSLIVLTNFIHQLFLYLKRFVSWKKTHIFTSNGALPPVHEKDIDEPITTPPTAPEAIWIVDPPIHTPTNTTKRSHKE
jgi:hypothetical protein